MPLKGLRIVVRPDLRYQKTPMVIYAPYTLLRNPRASEVMVYLSSVHPIASSCF